MEFEFTGDSNIETGVAPVVFDLSDSTEAFFKTKKYGEGVSSIFVVLMCRSPRLEFKRRIRFVKKEKTLYMDIMLDYALMTSLPFQAKRKAIIKILVEDVISVATKYKFKNFNQELFFSDLRNWFDQKYNEDGDSKWENWTT